MITRGDDGPTLSVVICAYTLDRWDDICAAVASVRDQRVRPGELLLVIDHCPELERRATAQLRDARVIPNSRTRGLSGARNTGVAAATGEVIAFLDDDAVADPQWTMRLLAGYRDRWVLGVGGLVRAWWESGRPRWFPPEFDWVVGCSYHGSPRTPSAVRNFTGANMSFRRADMVAAGGFRQDLGRVGTKPLGCEETELCLRMAALNPHAELRFEPGAVVRHHVPPTRTTWAYFRARCYAEGRSKAVVARHAGSGPALADERRYVRRTVPVAVVRSVLHAEFRAAATLCAGVGITMFGYTSGRARSFLAGSIASARRPVRSPA
ncbi:glycosyltransferase family 2 protein [Kitasatospora sp. NPDC088346]|uniref:glycosyltransferase family 2 protein n=1 Tax=Kitasatospora sp. NPDC088346 TaxID=3364073 RepID=UPI00380D5033